MDAETGQRGYLYTGDLHYLEPYNRATQEVDGQLDRVASLTADIALQREQVQHLRDLCHAKLKELADTIALARSGQTEEAKARGPVERRQESSWTTFALRSRKSKV